VRRLALETYCRKAGRVDAPDSHVHASGSLLDYNHGAEGVVVVGSGAGHAFTLVTSTQDATDDTLDADGWRLCACQ
jgi:L-asparaginase/Glu-tRNA(Gln) amidotransferase subunit D